MRFDQRNLSDIIAVPVAILAFLVLGWFAIHASPQGADTYQARLQANAEASLSNPAFQWASVSILGQRATLVGEAPNPKLRDLAKRRVLRSTGAGGLLRGGVISVRDNTTLAPSADPFEAHVSFSGDRLTVRANSTSPSDTERLRSILARTVPDSILVDASFDYVGGRPAGDWFGAFELGLESLMAIEFGEFSLSGVRLSLNGQADSIELRDEITGRLARPPSGYVVELDLTTRAIWSATLNQEGLRFDGVVPDAALRTQFKRLAERFYSDAILDETAIRAMDSANWVSGVRAALPSFVTFQTGRMSYLGDGLRIEGQATETAIDNLREDLVRLGTSLDVRLDITPVLTTLDAFSNLDEGERPTIEVCKQALAEAETRGGFTFVRSGSRLTRESGPSIDAVLAVFERCPQVVFQLEGYTHSNGRRIASISVIRARMTTVSDYFIARGVPLDQMVLTEVDNGRSANEDDGSAVNRDGLRIRVRE